MANKIFKAAPIIYENKKVAYIASHTVSLDSGDEEQIGQDGWLGWSQGQIMMTIDADLVVPVAGIDVPMLTDMIAKKDVTIGVPIEGKMLTADMRCVSIKYSSDSKAGSLKCSATFKGPRPSI